MRVGSESEVAKAAGDVEEKEEVEKSTDKNNRKRKSKDSYTNNKFCDFRARLGKREKRIMQLDLK